MKEDILKESNIIINCKKESKDTIIKKMGQMLIDSGYVQDGYIDAMLQREEVFSTNIGNGIAMPHGVEEAKKYVINSGIGIMVFPEGIMWNEELVKVVIGVAGVGEDHIDILAKIAEVLSEETQVEKLVLSQPSDIYQMFAE